jgi:transposase-like protein
MQNLVYVLPFNQKNNFEIKYTNIIKKKIMTQMYHYATVSKALDELNENGFTYDFNLHEEDIAKNPQKYEIKTFTAMKETLIQG